MLEGFEVKGVFYVPFSDEQTHGILKFSQNEGIELDLFGDFDDFKNPSSDEHSIILGYTSEGKQVTLLNCYKSSARMNFPGFPQSKFVALQIFIGKHFNSIEDIYFDYCEVEYEGLNYWLDITGFSRPKYNDKWNKFEIEYNTPDKIQFPLDENWNVEIIFSFSAPSEYFLPVGKVELKQKAVLKFMPKTKVNYQEFHKITHTFSKFLAINYFNFPLIKNITFMEFIKKEDENDTGKNEITLLYKSPVDIVKYRDHINSVDFIIEYKNYNSKFHHYIKEWFVLHDKVEASINILTEIFMGRTLPTQLNFISLTQALENYHARIFNKPRKDFLCRLNEIVDYLPEKIRDILIKNETDFAKRIRDNRNYYTHYSDNYKSKVVTLSELFILSEKMKIILMVILLKQISFTDVELEKLILFKAGYRFNHLTKPNR